ncbi:hypothetical protein EDC14_1001316 [Hydrogenispora ethanolica]|uniref:Uncharacterized protein n=1 Tax=Hydrogenispora ethanolica TaxID=1082276 RepID=A0A4R1SBY0_HYDET|nr:hypothetical protein [Hydrogenispora ethanolica]TCL77031.1 hypothetical protein EDC14_1001316 [Hydrogenispora ethanolica]
MSQELPGDLEFVMNQFDLLALKEQKSKEIDGLTDQVSQLFAIRIQLQDVLVASIAGLLSGVTKLFWESKFPRLDVPTLGTAFAQKFGQLIHPGRAALAVATPDAYRSTLEFFQSLGFQVPAALQHAPGFMELFHNEILVDLQKIPHCACMSFILQGYTFIFKVIPGSPLAAPGLQTNFADLFAAHQRLLKENGFYAMQMIAQFSAYITENAITSGANQVMELLNFHHSTIGGLLLCTGRHLLDNCLEYQKLMRQIQNKAADIRELDRIWQENFETRLQQLSRDPRFRSILSEDWAGNDRKTRETFQEIRRRKLELQQALQELKEELQ